MSRTSLTRADGVRGSTEQKVTENYAATLAQNLYNKEVTDRTATDNGLRESIDDLDVALGNEAHTREENDDAIANGTRLIKPNLSSQTKYNGTEIAAALDFLTKIARRGKYDFGYTGLTFEFDNDLYLGGNAVFSDTTAYSGYSSLAAIAAAVATLNGNDTVNGSVDKKVKDAIDAFASAITDDGTVNTYAEVLNWIAAHGADFAALVGQVNTNTGKITTLETNMPASATAQEIREAWNPTPEPEPETPTVTISGAYDADSETLVISAEDMARLQALNVQELFKLVINATGVVYSGAAKKIKTITTSTSEEAPTYEFRNSIPLWDSEWSYDTFTDCYIISHYDSPDAGEIGGGSY